MPETIEYQGKVYQVGNIRQLEDGALQIDIKPYIDLESLPVGSIVRDTHHDYYGWVRIRESWAAHADKQWLQLGNGREVSVDDIMNHYEGIELEIVHEGAK